MIIRICPDIGMEGVITALETSLTTVSESCLTMISKALPLALPIVGAVVVIGVGIAIFRKVVSK